VENSSILAAHKRVKFLPYFWGASAETFRIASLPLVFSTAKYCASIWMKIVHVYKIDVQLNSAMRIISGTVKLTQLQWLPVLAYIEQPKLRRKAEDICSIIVV
jgi:hypothetical protein